MTGAPAKGVEVHRPGRRRAGSTHKGQARVASGFGPTSPPEGHPRLAAAGQDRRPGADRIARHRPRRANVSLRCHATSAIARQDLHVHPGLTAPSRRHTLALSRPGSSRAACWPPTPGRPIPNAVVSAATLVMNEHARGFFTAKFRADDQGRFVMNPIAGESYTLGASPPAASRT